MTTTSQRPSFRETASLRNALDWEELYRILPPYVLSCIRCAGIPAWYRQEYDVVEEIVQEIVVRIFTYTQKVEQGKAFPIHSLQHFSRMVAHNHCEDLRRKERRFAATSYDEALADPDEHSGNRIDPIEQVLEDMMLTHLFPEVARRIADFPRKQRTALLIDLANLSDFDESVDTTFTPLEQAFLAVGIHLVDYRGPLSDDVAARSRHSASLSYAYRRLRTETAVQLRELDLVA
jgi:DNA-directed RNA polymerase specialized sigma24 family protein